MKNLAQFTYKKPRKISIFTIIMSIYFLSLPLNTLGLGEFGSVLKYIGLLVFVCWFFFSSKFVTNKILIVNFFLLILFIFSSIYSVNAEDSFSRIITNFSLFLLIISVSGLENSELNYKVLTTSLVWSSRITAILVFFFNDRNYLSGRLTLGGLFIEDPNYLTGYFLFGFVFALFNIIKSKSLRLKIFSFVEVIVYFYLVLATGSRTGFITYVIIVLAIFIFGEKFKLKKILWIPMFFLFYTFLFSFASIFIEANVLQRFTISSIIESDGTGRYDLWIKALHIFGNSSFLRMVFGYGVGTIQVVYLQFGFLPKVVHNVFLEILIENGILGLLIYLTFVYQLIKSSIKFRDKRTFYILLGMIVISFAASIYTFKPYWNIILVITYLQKNNEDIKLFKNY